MQFYVVKQRNNTFTYVNFDRSNFSLVFPLFTARLLFTDRETAKELRGKVTKGDAIRFRRRFSSINSMLAYSIGQSSVPIPDPIVQLQVAASIGDPYRFHGPWKPWPSVSLYEEAFLSLARPSFFFDDRQKWEGDRQADKERERERENLVERGRGSNEPIEKAPMQLT